jgi:DNA invertase Pin-like site-specific DNA recombinase
MSTYAYVRVSTEMQTLENQEFEIRQWCINNNITVDQWVSESVSGTVPWESRKIGDMLRGMQSGDRLICTEISRLGRSLLMVMAILNYCSSNGIKIQTIKDRFELSDSLNSKIIAFAFALASEIERNLISQRTREALAAKRAAGVKLGRPRGHTEKVKIVCIDRNAVEEMIAGGVSLASVARRYGIHRNTLARLRRTGYTLLPPGTPQE